MEKIEKKETFTADDVKNIIEVIGKGGSGLLKKIEQLESSLKQSQGRVRRVVDELKSLSYKAKVYQDSIKHGYSNALETKAEVDFVQSLIEAESLLSEKAINHSSPVIQEVLANITPEQQLKVEKEMMASPQPNNPVVEKKDSSCKDPDQTCVYPNCGCNEYSPRKNEDFVSLENKRLSWSKQVFTEATAESSLLKLEEEIQEIREGLMAGSPDSEEYADAVMCLFDSAGRAGISIEVLQKAFSDKLAKNLSREWKKNDNNTYSHIKKQPPTGNPLPEPPVTK